MPAQIVIATVEDKEARITLPDGTIESVPHQSRAVAGLLLAGWVDARVREWSHGAYTAIAIDEERGSSGPTSLDQIFGAAARTNARSFSLRPA